MITIGLILLSVSVKGQTYHEIINSAELKIIDGDYKSSLNLYLTAFKKSDRNFAVDLFNASICAVKINKKNKAIILCKALAEKGVGVKFFTGNVAFLPLSNSKFWPQILRDAARARDSFHNANNKLLALLDSLVERDQAVNLAWRNAPGDKRREARLHMDEVYDTLSRTLKTIFDTVGFVSEFSVGVRVKNDTLINDWFPFYIIMVHNYQARMTGDTLFSSTLKKALAEQLIKPSQYAMIPDFGGSIVPSENYRSTQHYIQYNCNLYKENVNDEMVEEIDSLRNSIHLEPLADNLRKIVFNIKNPNTPFIIFGRAAKYMSFTDKESERFFLDHHKMVQKDVCR